MAEQDNNSRVFYNAVIFLLCRTHPP